VRLALNSAWAAYRGRAERIEQLLRAVALQPRLARAVEAGERGVLAEAAASAHRVGGMDLLFIADASCEVLSSATSASGEGVSLAADPIVALALSESEASHGTVQLPGGLLARLAPPLAEHIAREMTEVQRRHPCRHFPITGPDSRPARMPAPHLPARGEGE
jgi:hypothetical protein